MERKILATLGTLGALTVVLALSVGESERNAQVQELQATVVQLEGVVSGLDMPFFDFRGFTR